MDWGRTVQVMQILYSPGKLPGIMREEKEKKGYGKARILTLINRMRFVSGHLLRHSPAVFISQRYKRESGF